MPNLRIETNVSAESIKDLSSFLSELSKAVSDPAITGFPLVRRHIAIFGKDTLDENT